MDTANKRKHAAQGKVYTSQAQMFIVTALQYFRMENATLPKHEQCNELSVSEKVVIILEIALSIVKRTAAQVHQCPKNLSTTRANNNKRNPITLQIFLQSLVVRCGSLAIDDFTAALRH